MKPAEQTIFGEEKGNCMAACVASLLEFPTEIVPNFCEDAENWCQRLQAYLLPFGLDYVEFEINESGKVVVQDGHHCILVGKSPRGDFDHAVVGIVEGTKAKIVHDPHPSKDGLKTTESIGFFISTDPAAQVRNMKAGRVYREKMLKFQAEAERLRAKVA